MPSLHFIDADALSRFPGFGSQPAAEALLLRVGLQQGAPFILDDNGRGARLINDWLFELPELGCPSLASQIQYAKHALAWLRFLDREGTDLLAAGRKHVRRYHAERRLCPPGTKGRLSPESWNNHVAALQSLHGYLADTGHRNDMPFAFRVIRVGDRASRTRVARRNLSKERTSTEDATLRWLETDRLDFFLNVGMSGLTPDYTDDPTFLGRNPTRNAAAGRFLASSGLREQELAYMLAIEIPGVPDELKPYVWLYVPPGIGKGGRARWTVTTPEALRDVHSYIDFERAQSAARSGWRPPGAKIITDSRRQKGRIDGRLTKWKTLSTQDRARLVHPDGGSPLLMLQSNGAPLTEWDWNFRQATKRCQKFDPDFPDVTPHTLRHTFAVHFLRHQIRVAATRVRRHAQDTALDLLATYWRVDDPLVVLRDRLGHRYVTTTQKYLHALNLSRLYVNALQEVDDGLGPLDGTLA